MSFKTPHQVNVEKKAYAEKLSAMTDEDLYKEAKQKIWLSAYANNNPRSRYHWQCDATYEEAKKREGDIYSKAWEAASSEAGH